MKEKLEQLLRQIAMGRPNAAEELAELLVTLFDKQKKAVNPK